MTKQINNWTIKSVSKLTYINKSYIIFINTYVYYDKFKIPNELLILWGIIRVSLLSICQLYSTMTLVCQREIVN